MSQILVQQEPLHNTNPLNLQFNNSNSKILYLGFMRYWLLTFPSDEKKCHGLALKILNLPHHLLPSYKTYISTEYMRLKICN